MTAPQPKTQRVQRTGQLPGYIHHPEFETSVAAREYEPAPLLDNRADYETRYMPDEATREHAKRMHYAAYRMRIARTQAVRSRWHSAYLGLRDRIVLGNRKLIYRAVRRRLATPSRADDMIGDSHIVLIHAVAAFNPWLNIRFSTYAYTCLVRGLSRSSQRMSADWLARALSLDALPDGEPRGSNPVEPRTSQGALWLDEFLRDDHPLLSDREKSILSRRFSLTEDTTGQTLERVGRELGLSKERVRQVQASALGKLRLALASAVE